MTVERDAPTTALQQPIVRGPLPVRLQVLEARAAPQQFVLASGSCVIGAGRGADVVIDDETVSRRHAELALTAEGVQVTDLGSRNGTFYLGQKLGQLTVRLGSRIQLGKVELRLEPSTEALEQLPRSQLESYGALLGRSPAMRRLFAVLQRLEGALVTVLIEGDSGTGKELVARAIHDCSLVSKGPFVPINCGALDRALVRSELFGHARGAFTGATETRVGAFEAASGGTLFLDEIGDLPLDVQPVLLRALENGTVARVGESQERPVNVRVVAATNQSLFELSSERRFREDLYYRLAIVRLNMPRLDDRREDVTLLAQHFARQQGVTDIPEDILHDLSTRDWPGNVRELKNAIRAYLALGSLSSGPRGSPRDDLRAALLDSIDFERPYAELKEELLDSFLRLYVERLLTHTGGNQSEAARISGLERSYFSKVVRRISKGGPR
ncbi:MAG TPA: sigma 54-interacting transcriptional regulator [Polyangiaceae bacterium]|nr:sigma 54-interacting transcriptional regulator [Polyangiaceae bacterium]